MRNLKFWQEVVETMDNCDEDGNGGTEKLQWHCSDGISTFFGDTKTDAASRFGVPVGF